MVFLIDNADIVVYDRELIEEMWKSENQFVLFGRNSWEFAVPYEGRAFMEKESDNKFSLKYLRNNWG